MKKFITFLLLIPTLSFGQCKYDKNEYDKFQKIQKLEKEVKVNKANGSGNGYMAITFCKYDTLTFIRVTYIKKDALVVGKQNPVIFLFDDDASIKASPNQIYAGDMRISTGQEVLNAVYYFENKNAFEQMKSKKVKSIRIYYNDVYTDYDIKDKFSESLQKAANCF